MEFSAAVIRTCQATAAETARMEAEVPPVFLYQDVRRNFRCTKKTMQSLIYRTCPP